MSGSCASAISKWADGTPCGMRENYVMNCYKNENKMIQKYLFATFR